MDDENNSLSISLKQNTIYIMYLWISEPINGAKYLVKGNNIVYLSDNG